jgi:hypothetical protein
MKASQIDMDKPGISIDEGEKSLDPAIAPPEKPSVVRQAA